MANLKSTLTIKLIDDVSAPARAAAAALKGIGASANDIERLTKIDIFRRQQKDFATARATFQQAQAEVKRLSAAMAAAVEPSKKLTSSYASAQREVKAASRAFEQQSVAIKEAKAALETAGVPLGQLTSEERRLATAADAATAAMQRQAQRARTMPWGQIAPPPRAGSVPIIPRPREEPPVPVPPRRPGVVLGRVLGGVAPFAGPAILHVTKKTAESGAQIQHEVVKLRAAGVPESDIGKALDQSVELQTRYPNVKRSDMLETYKDLRSVLQHPQEAHELLDTTVKARSAMNAMDPTGHMAEGLTFAIKAAEVLGLAQDPKRYASFLDAFVKAQQVVGKTITPEQQFEFAKYSKASGAALSDRFKTTTAVSLSQEMGGATAGVSVDQFVKQIVGGFQGNQHAAAKEFVALGLADKEDFETTKTGEIKGLKHGHHPKGSALAQSDPDKWVYEYLVPALESHGFTTQEQQIAEVRRLFPSGRAADVVAKMITQKPSFQNHAKLYEEALGLNALEKNQADPFVALNSLTTSLTNFAATLTSPIMSAAAGAMSWIAKEVSGLAQALSGFQKEHPDIAKWLGGGALAAGLGTGGVLTYQLFSGLMTGFGLPGAATALDTAAVHLEAAAAKLGGTPNGAVVPGGGPSGGTGADLISLAKGILGRAGLAGAVVLDANEKIRQKYGPGPSWDDLLAYFTGRADIVGEQGWFAAPGPGSLDDVRKRLGLPPVTAKPVERTRSPEAPSAAPVAPAAPAAVAAPAAPAATAAPAAPAAAAAAAPAAPAAAAAPAAVAAPAAPAAAAPELPASDQAARAVNQPVAINADILPPDAAEKMAQAGQQAGAALHDAAARAVNEPVKPQIDNSAIAEGIRMLEEFKQLLLDLGNITVRPSVEPHVGGIGHASLSSSPAGKPQQHSSAADWLRGSYADYGIGDIG